MVNVLMVVGQRSSNEYMSGACNTQMAVRQTATGIQALILRLSLIHISVLCSNFLYSIVYFVLNGLHQTFTFFIQFAFRTEVFAAPVSYTHLDVYKRQSRHRVRIVRRR